MVMRRNVMRKNLLQTIRKSIGRYIAIVAIIALGSGMFVGLVTTKSDMIATAQEYTREQNMFHLRLLNTYGWTQAELDKISALEGVVDAEGSVTLDAIAQFGEKENSVYRLHLLPEQINKVYLLGGRMPQHPNECLADGAHVDDSILGTQVFISQDNEQETLDSLNVETFTVVGYVSTPLYMDANRGTTTIGNGTLTSYLFVPREAFDVDYYTEISVSLGHQYDAYSDGLDDLMEDTVKRLEPEIISCANDRYMLLKSDAQSEYDDALRSYEQGVSDLETAKRDAEKELADGLQVLLDAQADYDENHLLLQSAEKQLEAAYALAGIEFGAATSQLPDEQKQMLDEQAAQLAAAKLELEKARVSLEEGWQEYQRSKEEADVKFAEAEQELLEAKPELDDAAQMLADMAEPEVYILDRNTNAGYLAVNSNSDIVEGVSKVFPAFFLFIAALVCITTLTKMVDEERTQIGVLKAMGYRNSAIIRKYLLYCGSAAVLGCGLGVAAGSVVFPTILWKAYSIILCVRPDVVLQLNVPLCLAVVCAYTVISMAVTWMCCRHELREVPAQLIRPKAPAAGKKIFMEYLPFWNRMSFLNKVMFRNVFRYRQRLLMMLVGIGGCTALLLTGFGIRDSIGDIVDYQFDEVTVYDMEVYFSEAVDEEQQSAFREEMGDYAEQMVFYHRTNMELEYGKQSQNVIMLASDEELNPYINLHCGEEKLTMPPVNEVLLSAGAAEKLGLEIGDDVILRNSDMEALSVRIAGIFDNHVHNYVIVHPETMLRQWGREPAQQMVMLNIRADQDAHAAGAEIAAMEHVMSVSISQDVAEQVGGMLDALDLVVVTVVVCAGLLVMIVLYNLTNISISERIREIATIKVLGFQPREAAAYVFKENLLLSAMGAAVGLVGGIFLLKFVMSQIRIDMVWFQDRLTWPSYLFSFVLTMVFACMVDFVLYFKLEKINMAEALKSVE